MNKTDFTLLRRIVLEQGKILQDGRHSTAEEWQDIADELTRAAKLAQTEANKLAEEENG